MFRTKKSIEKCFRTSNKFLGQKWINASVEIGDFYVYANCKQKENENLMKKKNSKEIMKNSKANIKYEKNVHSKKIKILIKQQQKRIFCYAFGIIFLIYYS